MNAENCKQWVWESLLLDLAHDEEEEALAKEATTGGPLNLDEALRRFTEPPTISDFLNEESISRKLRTLNIQQKYFWHFKTLKWCRVETSLKLNRTAKNYANDRQKANFSKLRVASNIYERCLYRVYMQCMGAMGSIVDNLSHGSSWSTLLGLYHSEACAAARPEVSYGLATSYPSLIDSKTIGSKLFAWVALHNMARGLNHMNKQLEASRQLDYKVDSFQERNNIQNLLADLPRGREKQKEILFRLLYFPAVLTLAQSLEDLGRHAERRFYLRKGMEKARALKAKYWIDCFRVKIAFSDLDTQRIYSDCHHKPAASTPKQDQLQRLLCSDCNARRDGCPSQKESDLWLLCWHACDPDKFYVTLQRTCNRYYKSLLGAKARSAAKQALVSDIFDVLQPIHAWIEPLKHGEALSDAQRWLRHLLGEADDRRFPTSDRAAIWWTAKELYQVLYILNESRRNRDLNRWVRHLKTLIESEDFDEFRSFNELFETIPQHFEPQWTCPAIPRKVTLREHSHASPLKSEWDKRCGSHGCTYRMLHLEDKTLRPNYASLDYFLSVMAAQQARFKLYLQERTAREKYFRPGEAGVPSPEFEIITLRRWNSFSPNLGSRASVTVGGGYLVRIYDNSAKRYLGIAVDPGYNYLENLFNEGFTVPDVDLVVVTHAHPDHTENLTNIFTLLRERAKRVGSRECSVLLAVTDGVFERYSSHLKSEGKYIRDIAVLHAEQCRGSKASESALWLWNDGGTDLCHMELGEPGLGKLAVSVEAKQALHGDGTKYDSIGIVITRQGRRHQKAVRLGIMSDSRYHDQLSKDYSQCNVIVAHLGSLLKEDWYKNYNDDPNVRMKIREYLDQSPPAGAKPKEHSRKRLNDLLSETNHLYLPGLARFVCDLNPREDNSKRVILLSEFGEELRGGLRKALISRLCEIGGENMSFVPADVGLRVDITTGCVFCSICHRYIEPNQIAPYSVLPSEEAMAYVCSDCMNCRSGEIDRLVEEWCHSGRPVVPLKTARGSQSASAPPEADLQPPKQS